MPDYAILLSYLAFSVLISGDLGASAQWARLRQQPKLLQALDVVFWASWFGLLVLPASIVIFLLKSGTTWAERTILAVVCGVAVTLMVGLLHVKRQQSEARQDNQLLLRIDFDDKTVQLWL